MQCFLKSKCIIVEISMVKIGELLRKLRSLRSCFRILPPGAFTPQGIEGAMKHDMSKHWCTLQWCASRGWYIAHENWTSWKMTIIHTQQLTEGLLEYFVKLFLHMYMTGIMINKLVKQHKLQSGTVITQLNISWYNLHSNADTNHDDVIIWKHFSHYWPFVRGIHQSLSFALTLTPIFCVTMRRGNWQPQPNETFTRWDKYSQRLQGNCSGNCLVNTEACTTETNPY